LQLLKITQFGREIRDFFRLNFDPASRTLANFTMDFVGVTSEDFHPLYPLWDGVLGFAPFPLSEASN